MKKIIIWSISRTALGQKRQVEALTNALSHKLSNRIEIKHFDVNYGIITKIPFFYYLPLRFLLKGLPTEKLFKKPAMVISCGRAAGLINLKLKQNFNSLAVHLESPQNINAFDLVIAPTHDFAKKDYVPSNVITTIGALSPFAKTTLAKSPPQNPAINNKKKYRISLLIGGDVKASFINRYVTLFVQKFFSDIFFTPSELMTDKWSQNLIDNINQLLTTYNNDIQFWVTFSRRTSPRIRHKFTKAFSAVDRVWIWDDVSENPLSQMLTNSTSIWVTGDSVAMISQAIATDVPVTIIQLIGKRKKLSFFRKEIYASKKAKPLVDLNDKFLVYGKCKPLEQLPNICDAVADLITKK